MKKKLWLVLLLAVAAGTGYFVWDSHLSPKAQAMQVVKRSLKDPGSAIFEQVRHITRTGATCGGVNAKNGMGGYVGMTAFIVGKDGKVTFAPRGNPEVGSPEAQLKILNEQLDFLNKREVCTVDVK